DRGGQDRRRERVHDLPEAYSAAFAPGMVDADHFLVDQYLERLVEPDGVYAVRGDEDDAPRDSDHLLGGERRGSARRQRGGRADPDRADRHYLPPLAEASDFDHGVLGDQIVMRSESE